MKILLIVFTLIFLIGCNGKDQSAPVKPVENSDSDYIGFGMPTMPSFSIPSIFQWMDMGMDERAKYIVGRQFRSPYTDGVNFIEFLDSTRYRAYFLDHDSYEYYYVEGFYAFTDDTIVMTPYKDECSRGGDEVLFSIFRNIVITLDCVTMEQSDVPFNSSEFSNYEFNCWE